MKHKYFWIIAPILVIIATAAILLVLPVQSESNHPPPPDLPRPVGVPGGESRRPEWAGPPPTKTPRPDEIKNLPTHLPPKKSDISKVIDTAPNMPHELKSSILIERGKSGKKVVIFFPWGKVPPGLLKKYLDAEAGDTYHISPPPLGRPHPHAASR